jgi:RNA polymerase sigma-70 factor (ECF subfamily)
MPDRVQRVFDEYVVLLAQSGDRGALERLAVRWRPRHFAHARRLLGHPADAADAVQDAWIGVMRGLAGLRRPELFPSWSFSIVTRRCHDHLRKRVRQPTMDSEVDAPCEGEDPGSAHDLRRALASLPADQRAAVALVHLEDFTISEVATALRIPPGTVKSRLFNARRTLREFYKGGTDEQT